MYSALLVYCVFLIKDNGRCRIKVWQFFVCAMVDVHATLLIVFAYNFTSITSVMLLEDFTIPSAVLLSIFFLKIEYGKKHFGALALCVCGMSLSLFNDLFVKK